VPDFNEVVKIKQHDLIILGDSGGQVSQLGYDGSVAIRGAARLTVGSPPPEDRPGADTSGPAAGTVGVFGIDGVETVVLSGDDPSAADAKGIHGGSISLCGDEGKPMIRLNGAAAAVSIGAEGGMSGTLIVRDSEGRDVLAALGSALVTVGAQGNGGRLHVRDDDGRVAIDLDGIEAALVVGGAEQNGRIEVRDDEGRIAINLDGTNTALSVGGAGENGSIEVRDHEHRAVLSFEATDASLHVGAEGSDGDLFVYNHNGRRILDFDGGTGFLNLGTDGQGGDLLVRDSENRPTVTMDGESAKLSVGGTQSETPGRVVIRDGTGADAIELDGASADIKLMGADLAEDFHATTPVAPGTVVVAAGAEQVEPARTALDRRVVGVVSGAGRFKTALRLGSRPGQERVPVAIVGRVCCRVDARHGAIAAGDLLTTSPTEGCAMRVDDPGRAAGAVLGKALQPLRTGAGLIPVLLTLR
jgi:hypothetical protein